MIIPSKRLLWLSVALVALALAFSIAQAGNTLFLILASLVAGIVLLDALWCWIRPHSIHFKRILPQTLVVGMPQVVHIQVEGSQRTETLQLYDHVPADFQVTAQHLPLQLLLPAQQNAEVGYEMTPVKRGLAHFTTLQVRTLSRLGLWWRDRKIALAQEVKVYPNYTAFARYTLLAAEQQLNQMGINRRPRRGEGQDFHQLRDYREGDSIRQIDWKASARIQALVTREYQEARDQEVLIMVDCGHRMTAHDQTIAHFDYVLNAVLLLAHVALKQGDAVGLGTFGTAEPRWILPKKGQYGLQQLLTQTYDLQPSEQAPDYYQAALSVVARQKRRALVLWITNLRDEDQGDLLPALQLVRKRHPVVIASLHETAIDVLLEQTIHSLPEALDYAAAVQHLQTRATLMKTLQASGIAALDVMPTELAAKLVNHYLDIKRNQLF
ncbi:DUF58 domain-containing protein [Thiofilum flexile]|uniref:DUF58 domain-containing protein n=1 Tax=Thiofilum flexile TaxID=125627 RepID=UPI00036F91EF|nr:DUF58 domain-containing protein [Thiofilum flexile]